MRTSGEAPRNSRGGSSGLLAKFIAMAAGAAAILVFVLMAQDSGTGGGGTGSAGIADLFGQDNAPAGQPGTGNQGGLVAPLASPDRPATDPSKVAGTSSVAPKQRSLAPTVVAPVALTVEPAGNFNFVAPSSAPPVLTPLARPTGPKSSQSTRADQPMAPSPPPLSPYLPPTTPLSPYLPPADQPTDQGTPPASSPPSSSPTLPLPSLPVISDSPAPPEPTSTGSTPPAPTPPLIEPSPTESVAPSPTDSPVPAPTTAPSSQPSPSTSPSEVVPPPSEPVLSPSEPIVSPSPSSGPTTSDTSPSGQLSPLVSELPLVGPVVSLLQP